MGTPSMPAAKHMPPGRGPDGAPHLDHDAGRLGEVPQWDAKQADERRLGLMRLRAASAQDAAPWKQRPVSGSEPASGIARQPRREELALVL